MTVMESKNATSKINNNKVSEESESTLLLHDEYDDEYVKDVEARIDMQRKEKDEDFVTIFSNCAGYIKRNPKTGSLKIQPEFDVYYNNMHDAWTKKREKRLADDPYLPLRRAAQKKARAMNATDEETRKIIAKVASEWGVRNRPAQEEEDREWELFEENFHVDKMDFIRAVNVSYDRHWVELGDGFDYISKEALKIRQSSWKFRARLGLLQTPDEPYPRQRELAQFFDNKNL